MNWSAGLLCLLFMIGHTVSTTPVASAPPPPPEIIDLAVDSPAVAPGDPVIVEIFVRNNLNRDGEFKILLVVDDVPEQERTVSLPAGTTQTLRFVVVRSEPGIHVIRVGAHVTSFHVLASQFLVRGLSINPPVVSPGDPLMIQATVENIGSAPGMFQIPLSIDGSVVDVRSNFLPTGQSKVVVFEITPKTPGVSAVMVGDLPGAFTVSSHAFDINLPSYIRISLPTTKSSDKAGNILAITGDKITISSTAQMTQVILPIALSPGYALASLKDPVSGIDFDGTRLVIPLRNASYETVAQVVATITSVTGHGAFATATAQKLHLVIPDTTLNLPPASMVVKPVTFGLEMPLRALNHGAPLRLNAGLRPMPHTLVMLELEARAHYKTVESIIASATTKVPAILPADEQNMASVTFGVPSSWLESINLNAIEIALITKNNSVELFPITEYIHLGSQTLLKTTVANAEGIFLLIVTAKYVPAIVSQVNLPSPIAFVEVPVEIRAVVNPVYDNGRPTNAILFMNNEPVSVEPLRIQENGSLIAFFYKSMATPGIYDIVVEGVEAQLLVGLKDVAGHVQVSDLSITPQHASPGEVVNVVAKVLNVGPLSVVSEAILLLNGSPIQKQLLAIQPGDTTEVHFQLIKSRIGVYEVSLLNVRGTFTVEAAPTTASIYVTDLKVTPLVVPPNQEVDITFTVKNTGEQQGVYLAKVFLNGEKLAQQEVLVDGLSTLPLSFSILPKGQGIFTVGVSKLRRDFVVVSPTLQSDLVLETIDLEPTKVSIEGTVKLTAKVRNRSNGRATGVLTVLVNESVVAKQDIDLEARSTTEKTFSLMQDTPGLYLVEVTQGVSGEVATSILKGQFLVTSKLSPPSWEISRLEITPQPASANEPLDISFLLSNLGQQAGQYNAVVSVNGIAEVEENLHVKPMTTENIAIPLGGRPAGTYTLSIGATKIQFVVTDAVEETPVALATPSDIVNPQQNPDDLIIVLAIAAFMVTAGVAFWLFKNRSAARP